MLPNMRLSGTANDSMSDFLAVSSASEARSAAGAAANSIATSNLTVKNNAAAASFAAASRSFAASVSSSGWGQLPTSVSSSSPGSNSFVSTVGGVGGLQQRTLSDQVKESTGWSQQASNSSTSMPWAAAVKAPVEQQHHNQHPLLQQHHHSSAFVTTAAAAHLAALNAFGDSGNTIGSWTSPETVSSTRPGWNADGSMRGDGIPDDGTAIWGNPSTKKTGIDWTERESLLNPPQANSNPEKRSQKSEPIISSLNGTEAWGAPAICNASNIGNNGVNNSNNKNSQQQANLSENSGNNYVDKTSTANNEPLSWGESSSLQAATKNQNSSPTSDSVWNYLNPNIDSESKRKTSSADWLASGGGGVGGVTGNCNGVIASNNHSSRIDELSKQLEATNLFNGNSVSTASSLLAKSSSSTTSNNPNLDNNNIRQSSASMLGNSNSAGTIGASLLGGVNVNNSGGVSSSGASGVTSNAMNDLKQHMSANFATNNLLESSPIRQQQQQASTVSASNNQTQSQLGAHSLGVTPSRELLKQMVHQIQLAVQAGHLNAHILNQPLSTPTLQLVYTLLQQIKLLQQFQEIQQRAQSVNKSVEADHLNNHVAHQSNLDLQITRVQQNISLLQKAITQQQAALTKNESLVESNLKQQQQQAAAAAAAMLNNTSYNNSYADISKLSTNMKVPSSTTNMSNTISNTSNIDSFRRSSLIDTLSNSNSDQSHAEAQINFEANANLDKNLSPLLQTSASLNNILNKQQTFTNNRNANQQGKSNLLSSTAQASTSPAAAAWLAFAHGGDQASIQGASSIGGGGASGWCRLPNQEQQQRFNSDLLPELSAAKAWRGAASFLSSDGSDSASNQASSMAPGSNMVRPGSASKNVKQMSENDILNKDPSSFYDWTSPSQPSDSIKRNFDTAATSSSFSPAIGGLSLQSNPWLFAAAAQNSLNLGGPAGSINSMINDKINAKNKLDNGNTDKIRVGADPLNFLGSNCNTGNNAQRAVYEWGDLNPAGASSLQFNNDNNSIGSNKQTATSSSSSGSLTGRPAPPPGLISNLGPLGTLSVDEISSILESDNSKQANSNNETQRMPSHESSSSLWSGAWFD